MPRNFTIVSKITDIEIIARGTGVRIREWLNQTYGRGRWRKLKGTTIIEYENGELWLVEIHWFEAHGIGRRRETVKREIRRMK